MRGVITAIVSPMLADGSLDLESFRRAVEHQVISGVQGIVVTGTTGEVSTLSTSEHLRLIETAVDQVRKRIPVIAGTGSNSTEEAIDLTKRTRQLGVSVTLQVSPYYNKPSQEGLYWHFRKISESVDVDLILYNVPSRSGVAISVETICQLSQLPSVIGIKDTSSNAVYFHKLINSINGRLLVYSGDDLTSWGAISLGAAGVISVLSNLFPSLTVSLCNSARTGSITQLGKLSWSYLSLCKLLFVESNPIPIKWTMVEAGLLRQGIRLPLTSYRLDSQPHLLTNIVNFVVGSLARGE